MRLPVIASIFVAAAISAGCAGTAPLAPKAIALNDEGARAFAADDLEHAVDELGLALEYNRRFT